MSNYKEGSVAFSLDGAPKVMPYHGYYFQRNGRVAREIATILGRPFYGEIALDSLVSAKEHYVVPVKTIRKEEAMALGLNDAGDFYGVVVDHLGHVGKAILHETKEAKTPKFYSKMFAAMVEDLVLPGATAFSFEQALEAGVELTGRFGQTRLKQTDKSDGQGQFEIKNSRDLERALNEVGEAEVQSKGIVLEPNLMNRITISVGFAQIGEEKFGTLVEQRNDIDPDDSRDRFLGGYLVVARGGMEKLLPLCSSETERRAVRTATKFVDKYSGLDPIISRISLDYLVGETVRGRQSLAGITDITGRLGGNCPALVLAIKEMKNRPELTHMRGETRLNYTGKPLAFDEGAEVFIDDPTLRITAKVDEHHGLQYGFW